MQENTQEKSPVKQRILKFLAYKGISQYECYVKTGITRGVLAQNNGISEQNLIKFLAYYTEVSSDWALLGVGSMLREQPVSSEKEDLSSSPESHNLQEPIPEYKNGSGIYYEMYKEKDAEVSRLNETIGVLKERIRRLEEEE